MPPKPLPKGAARPQAPPAGGGPTQGPAAPQSPGIVTREGATFGNTLRAQANLFWDPSADSATAAEAATVAERLARSDPAFASYLRRLRDSDKMYFTTRREFLDESRGFAGVASPTSPAGASANDSYGGLRDAMRSEVGSGDLADSVVPPAVDVDGRMVLVRWTHSRWPELVAREYIAKKHRYGARVNDTRRIATYVAVLLTVLIVALYAVWPVWGFLIDVDAGQHYHTLGVTSSATSSEVKKAYRTMTRQWHPDQNPGCGEPCKAKMRDIQHAYDVLLSKGDRQTASEMKRKTQEAIEQLMAFVFYRGFSMAFNTATFISYFVVIPMSLVADRAARASLDSWVTFGIKIAVLLVFCVFTVVNVTGPNFMMIMISGYRVLLQLREDRNSEKSVRGAFDDDDGGARTSGGRDLVKATTLGNFDLPKNLLIFVLPAVAGHFAYVWSHTVSASAASDAPAGTPIFSLGKYSFQLVFGLVYLCSHLIHFPPNLFDNMRMLECTVPLPYFSVTADHVTGKNHRSVSFRSVLMAEFGFLIDDVFAFVTQVPAPYRLAVYICHALFLVQMYSMPWAQPMDIATTRSARLHEKLLARRAAAAAAASTTAGGDDNGADGGLKRYSAAVKRLVDLVGGAPSAASPAPAASTTANASPAAANTATPTGDGTEEEDRPMSQRELLRIAGLDRDRIGIEQLRADVQHYSLLKGAGLARLKLVQDVLAKESANDDFTRANTLRRHSMGVLANGLGIGAAFAIVAVLAAAALPLQQKDLTFRHWRRFQNSDSGLARNPYDVSAAIEAGGVPLPGAVVGDDIRTRTVNDFAFSNGGLGAWGLALNGGERAQKRMAYAAITGSGAAPKSGKAKGKGRKGGKKNKRQ